MGQGGGSAAGGAVSGDHFHVVGDSLFQPNGSGMVNGSGVAQVVSGQWRQAGESEASGAF